MKKITLYFLVLTLNLSSFACLVGYAGNYEMPSFLEGTYSLYSSIGIYALSLFLFFAVKVKSADEQFLSDFELSGTDEHPKITQDKDQKKVEGDGDKIIDDTFGSDTVDSYIDLKSSVVKLIAEESKSNALKSQEELIGPIIEKEVPNKTLGEVIDFNSATIVETSTNSTTQSEVESKSDASKENADATKGE